MRKKTIKEVTKLIDHHGKWAKWSTTICYRLNTYASAKYGQRKQTELNRVHLVQLIVISYVVLWMNDFEWWSLLYPFQMLRNLVSFSNLYVSLNHIYADCFVKKPKKTILIYTRCPFTWLEFHDFIYSSNVCVCMCFPFLSHSLHTCIWVNTRSLSQSSRHNIPKWKYLRFK